MAYSFRVNQAIIATSYEAIFRFKEFLKTVGWTVTRSGDTFSYDAAGDIITHENVGVGGMANTRSWFVIRQPGPNGRELCFQSGASHQGRVKYSGGPGTGFVGGTPAANTVPSAVDEQVLVGSGTDASPSMGSWLASTSMNFRLDMCAGGAAEDYTFFLFCRAPGNLHAQHIAFLDAIEAGTAQPGDVDPAVVYWPSSSASGVGTILDMAGASPNQAVRGWLYKGLGNESFVNLGPIRISGTSNTLLFPGGSGSESYSGGDPVIKMMYGRGVPTNAAPYGFKGVGRLAKMAGVHRQSGDTLTIDATKDHIYVVGGGSSTDAMLILPWNGSDLLVS